MASISLNDSPTNATFTITDIDNRVASVGNGESASIDGLVEGNVVIPSNVTGPDGETYQVTGISGFAFFGCSFMNSITIPEGITKIGNTAFYMCSGLTTLTIPESVTTIGEEAFLYCDNLSEITIPINVTSIGTDAFAECSNLTSVTVEWAEPIAIDEECFSNAVNATLYVPAGTKALYKAATGWKNFGRIVEPNEDTDISQMDNVVYINSVEGCIGQQLTLSVKMKNTVGIQTVQFDLYLPDGVTVAKDDDGFDLIELSTERTTARKMDSFSSSQLSNGAYRVLINSNNGYTFDGEDGEIALVTVNISPEMAEGDYPVILKDIVLVNTSSEGYETEYVKSTLTVSDYSPGDVNGDGKVNAIDLNAIVNYILERRTFPFTFLEKAADLNGDGKVNAIDVNTVTNMILRGTTPRNAIAPTPIFVGVLEEK